MARVAWPDDVIQFKVPDGWHVTGAGGGTIVLSPKVRGTEFDATISVYEPNEPFRIFETSELTRDTEVDHDRVKTRTLRCGPTDLLPDAVERVQSMWTKTAPHDSFLWRLFSGQKKFWLRIKICDRPPFTEREQCWADFIRSIQITGDIQRLIDFVPARRKPKRKARKAKQATIPRDWPADVAYLSEALLSLQAQPVEDIDCGEADMSVALSAIQSAYKTLSKLARTRRSVKERNSIKQWCDAQKGKRTSFVAAASALQGLLFYFQMHGLPERSQPERRRRTKGTTRRSH